MRSPVRHLGTERAAGVLAAMRAELEDKIHIATDTAVAQDHDDHRRRTAGARAGDLYAGSRPAGRVTGVVTVDGECTRARW